MVLERVEFKEINAALGSKLEHAMSASSKLAGINLCNHAESRYTALNPL